MNLSRANVIKLLLEQGLDPNLCMKEPAISPAVLSLIYFAAKSGQLPIVKLLVEYGADVTLKDYLFH